MHLRHRNHGENVAHKIARQRAREVAALCHDAVLISRQEGLVAVSWLGGTLSAVL